MTDFINLNPLLVQPGVGFLSASQIDDPLNPLGFHDHWKTKIFNEAKDFNGSNQVFPIPGRRVTLQGSQALRHYLLNKKIYNIILVAFNLSVPLFEEFPVLSSIPSVQASLQNINDTIWYLQQLGITVLLDKGAKDQMQTEYDPVLDAFYPSQPIINATENYICNPANNLPDLNFVWHNEVDGITNNITLDQLRQKITCCSCYCDPLC